jgi:hypothetical protein
VGCGSTGGQSYVRRPHCGLRILAAIANVPTPLGTDIWTYILSFRNPALKQRQPREPVTNSAAAAAFVAIAAAVAVWTWSEPRGRSLTPAWCGGIRPVRGDR